MSFECLGPLLIYRISTLELSGDHHFQSLHSVCSETVFPDRHHVMQYLYNKL